MHYKTLNYIVDSKALTVTTLSGETLNIRPKTCQFLIALIEQAGEAVHKQTLLDKVWPESVVEEQIVFQSVKELRQLFHGHDVIKTLPKKGYIWLPSVEKVSNDDSKATTVNHNKKNKEYWLIAASLIMFSFIAYFALHTSNSPTTNTQAAYDESVNGSVIVLPTTNDIEGNDHSWVRLGMMDQIIQRLPNNNEYGVLQTDYVMEILARAGAPSSRISDKYIQNIFRVSGANLVVSTRLSGSPSDYQLSYTVFRPNNNKKSVLFGSDIQTMVDKLSNELANMLGDKAPLSAAQYQADFTNQMLGVAIDFRLENKHKEALPYLINILENNPENFTAQRIYIETLFRLRESEKAALALKAIFPIVEEKADIGEKIRFNYLMANNFLIQGKLEKATEFVDAGLALAKSNNDWLYQAFFTNVQAGLAIERASYQQAEQLYHTAMKYHKVIKCPVGQATTWIKLGQLAKRRSQIDKQKIAFENALNIAEQRGLTRQISYINYLNEKHKSE